MIAIEAMPTNVLGQPCWKRDTVAVAITSIAKVAVSQTHYFLASHAPVEHIRDDRTEATLTEEDLFRMFLKGSPREVLALVHGGAGTGKSHLIHWLKLRCESALKSGELKKLVPVLIQRRTGSLKDALEQMINQLGEEFAAYLAPVQEALSKISDSTAREKLAGELGLELGPRRADRGRKELPRDLRHLRETCTSTGFRRWLCRDGGVIDQTVKSLTQGRENYDQESPRFAQKDFLVSDARYKPENTPDVLHLIEDFEEEPELRETAAALFNEALRDAVKEMTGLTGTTLRDIFDRIRADLKSKGKNLALFIEDVSVMVALNEEVFNAVEPISSGDMCRMIAVLGITDEGWSGLWDNQRGRVTYSVGIGRSASGEWHQDTVGVEQFVARYLNTTRLPEDAVRAIAEQRRKGGDVHISACDQCPVRVGCHESFGSVEVGGVRIGTFPFSEQAAPRLLNHLKAHSAVKKTPRGMLTQILQPVLEDGYDDLEAKKFPSLKLAVSLPPLSYWSAFVQNYCGGWRKSDIDRLEFLAQAWVRAETAEEAASGLKPFLGPLGFREFSKQVEEQPKDERPTRREEAHTAPQPDNKKLKTALTNLNDWMNGEKYKADKEPRELLADLIRKSIPWDDRAYPPLDVWKTLLGSGDSTTKFRFIRLEEQTSLVSAKFIIDFPRNEETRALLEALIQYEHAGRRSWNFPHGELHKRTVARWLRKHRERIIAQLQPQSGLDTSVPVATAVQFLSTAAIVRQRRKLQTDDPVVLVESLLSDEWPEQTTTISASWKKLLEDVRLKHPSVKQFVVSELNVPQGRTGGRNFINALPLIQQAAKNGNVVGIELPPEDFYKEYWSSRYDTFERMSQYANLASALEAERGAIGDVIDSIRLIVKAAEYDAQDLPEALINFCTDLMEVYNAQKTTQVFVPPDPAFEDLARRKVFSERKAVWATALKNAQAVAEGDDPLQVLLFNAQTLLEVRDSLAAASQYLARLEKEVEAQLAYIEQEGDPDALKEAMIEALDGIANLPPA